MVSARQARPRRERKLPIQQLVILAICRFADPIAGTSLFPYLPEMIRSFGVPQNKVGKWAGLCSAVFSLCQAAMGIPWGRFADRYGRKPAVLIGLFSTLFSTLLWGFSTSLPMALVMRGISGAGSGNVGIIRTTVAEMVPFKELQPRAFSIMPLVWSIGSIFGPAFGGALANPYNVEPGKPVENPSLLQRFPYALPNIIAACFFMIGIITGTLFLEETLETVHKRDYGLRMGDRLSWAVKRLAHNVRTTIRNLYRSQSANKDAHLDGQQANGEREPLLKSPQNGQASPEYGQQSAEPSQSKPPPPSYRDVLTGQAVLNLAVYTLLALHNVGFDQLIPVFAQYPPLESKAHPENPMTLVARNPLQFAGGFGLNHSQIGMMNTAYGVCGMLVQFFIFPPVARKFGVLNCLRVCVCIYPILYLIIPFTALLPNRNSRVAGCFAVMVVKCFCSIFAVPSSTILLTNCASSLRVLGTLNGFATTFSALGRASGPALGGALFTIGVEAGYVIAPWWMFSGLATIAAIPVFFLVEGEGFGGDADDVEDDEDADEEDTLTANGAEDLEERNAAVARMKDPLEEQAQAAYGGMGLLSRSTTVSSGPSLGSDEYSTPGARSRETSVDVGEPSMGQLGNGSRRSSRPDASRQASTRSAGQRTPARPVRQTSLPFGMGNQGISRRYSSNLGQSFGTHDH